MKITLFTFFTFIIFSCVPPTPPMYYWGNYSHTLYKYKKDLTPEALEAHKEELHSIINKSQDLEINIPPGVNAELGYLFLLEGNKDSANYFFQEELKTYPEASQFMKDLISNVN